MAPAKVTTGRTAASRADGRESAKKHIPSQKVKDGHRSAAHNRRRNNHDTGKTKKRKNQEPRKSRSQGGTGAVDRKKPDGRRAHDGVEGTLASLALAVLETESHVCHAYPPESRPLNWPAFEPSPLQQLEAVGLVYKLCWTQTPPTKQTQRK